MKGSLRVTIILINLLSIIVVSLLLTTITTVSFKNQIVILFQNDYKSRLRFITQDYEAVDSVSAASEEVNSQQQEILTRLENKYLSNGSESGNILIMNGEGEEILSRGIVLNENQKQALIEMKTGNMTLETPDGRLWILFEFFEPWDWYTIQGIPTAVMYEPIFTLIKKITLLGLAAVVVLFIIQALYFTRKLKPVKFITQSLEKASQGYLSWDLKFRDTNEIGSIAASSEKLIQYLRGMVSNFKSNARENQERQVQLSHTLTSLQDSMDISLSKTSSIKNSTNQLQQQVKDETTSIQSIVLEIQNFDREIQEESSHLVETLEVVGTVMENLKSNQEKSRENAVLLQDLQEDLEAGRKELNLTKKTITDIEESVREVATQIKGINEVAERVNLLAMNASIEAAHAGESGKGFAVVAGEIRNLAASTNRITGSIDNMLVVINRNILQSVEQSSKMTEAFLTMGNSMEKFSRFVQDIFRSLDEQQNDVVSISSRMEKVGTLFRLIQERLRKTVGESESIRESIDMIAGLSSGVFDSSTEIESAINSDMRNLGALMQSFEGLSSSLNDLNAQIQHFRLEE